MNALVIAFAVLIVALIVVWLSIRVVTQYEKECCSASDA